jgi:plastocyanin domain-containing protein
MKTPRLFGLVVVLTLAAACAKTSAPAVPSTANAAAAPAPDGKQVFEVLVKDGYQPREILAKAGVPVTLKMKTQGTYDCSAVFTIPKLGIRVQLQPTGEAAIDIPAQKSGDSINGVCGMGMLSLVIKFT